MVNGKIQAFPKEHWRDEFPMAKEIGVSLMEWTLDQEGLRDNPFCTSDGQREILDLCDKYQIIIPSVTGDCFMQAPFYKTDINKLSLLSDLDLIIDSCSHLGVRLIVFPLVDNGSIENKQQEKILVDELILRVKNLRDKKVCIVFESDMVPEVLKDFIKQFPRDCFGINYDMGNSASLGFDPVEEFDAYEDRILNVHVKDRVLGGTTVTLGSGDVDFDKVFSLLSQYKYQGNYILQTARDSEGNHLKVLEEFSHYTIDWIKKYES